MRLRLVGHNYKYAVEQIMLMLFPDERPDYEGSDGETPSAKVTLTFGQVYAQAVTEINVGGNLSRAVSRVKRTGLCGKLETDRLLQRLIKQSFFKAARPFVKTPPVWGSLTGIRPGKLMTSMLERGYSASVAENILMREYHVSPERVRLCADAAQASLDVKRSLKPRDIALYIGIPFCPTRCAYCSFVSNSVEKSFELLDPFLATLSDEIAVISEVALKHKLRVISVYIGGGTPTTLSAEQLAKLMAQIKNSFDLSGVREYTVEAGRPDTITAEKLAAIKNGGATRVSVNPQSMSAEVLSAIGRRHTPEDVLEAVQLVRDCAGLELNMDLIAGLPGDTSEGFMASLDSVLRLCPENVTVHTLSLKKGSRITLDNTPIPDGSEVADMLDYAANRLRGRGFTPYYLYRQKFTSGGFENVGWSLPGYEGVYNLCMMEELCTVLALGGGGVTKLVSPGGRLERVFNVKFPLEYTQRPEKLTEKAGRIGAFYSAEVQNGL